MTTLAKPDKSQYTLDMSPLVYIRTLIGTLSSARFYVLLLKTPFWFSVRFLLISCVLLGWLSGWYFFQFELPAFTKQLQNTYTEIQTHFPEDLIITWNGEQLTHTAAEPFRITYPSGVDTTRANLPPVLAYLVKESRPAQELANQLPDKSWFIISPTHLHVFDLQDQWTSVPLWDVLSEEPFTITKNNLDSFVAIDQNLVQQLRLIIPLVIALVFPLLVMVTRFIQAVIESLLAFLLLRLLNINFSFPKVLQLSFHLVIVANLAEWISQVIYPETTFPIFSVVFWGFLSYILILHSSDMVKLSSKSKGE